MKDILNDQEPVKESKSSFVEQWGRAEEANAYIGLSLFVVGAICVILTVVLVRLVMRPQPIYYVPGAKTAGLAKPNQIEEASVRAFAESWLLNWTNFTPPTFKDMYEKAVKYMGPGLLSKMRAKIDDEIKKIESNNVSSIFIVDETRVKETNEGYEVTIAGRKTIYIGKENMDAQKVKYTLKLRLTAPTENNIYGMSVDAIDQVQVD